MKAESYHHGDLRRALLDAALEELADQGVEAFSLRRVARRAGVSHAAPAHHFGDVQGLLTALAAEGYQRFIAAMQARQDAAGSDPQEAVLAAGLGYVDFALAETALFRLIHASNKPDYEDPALAAAGAAAYGHISALVAEATGCALCSPELTSRVAAIWAQSHGLADLVSNGRLTSISSLTGAERDRAILTALRRVLLD
ncbi:MAG: TetR/AcrR family transcriptional regulator [Pseudomonadota bacterium]